MQHTGGAFKKLNWHGSAWPPLSAFAEAETDDDLLIRGCKVTNVSNVSLSRGNMTGYMSGKKTDDQLVKMVGITVALPAAFAGSVAEDVEPFIKTCLAPTWSGGALPAVTAGDGSTFTFLGENTLLSLLRAESGVVGDDPLQEGDEITITTRAKSLFLRKVEITKQGRNLAMRDQHAVTNLYVRATGRERSEHITNEVAWAPR
jgi:hypothetical protein